MFTRAVWCGMRPVTVISRLTASSKSTGPPSSSTTEANSEPPKVIHVEYEEPIYPEYIPRTGESFKVKKARVLYQSRKRGMTENGLILSTFAHKYLDTFNEGQLDIYDDLINKPSNDWEIYYWATGVKPTPEKYQSEIMDLLKEHVSNSTGEERLVQPNLPSL
ncbi:succinate dehydrogenase assembly factor 2, mitochondrial-like isoform X2 [Tubulanus polymorphus]|uniref:succinate dehydrogenase assembly factor 2, mitochondrial-like isoform X2 n=1 Tax=Tubulanus polymorphus TaxID=672921 RepID=UPI003DA37A59